MKNSTSSDMDYLSDADEVSICSQDTASSVSSSIELPQEWEVGFADNNGRLYYINDEKKETFWFPPQRAWKCCFRLPPGWEVAVDKNNFLYYINHTSKLTTYKHPNYENRQFEFLHQAFQARRRKVSILRHHKDGFGFVAGSEKPVIIRSVVAGSPADGQLNANDQIFSIGNQIAYNLPQPQVISMIRSCTDLLDMEVVATEDIQDVRNQGQLKSALMSRATRERRKSCPVSVRFEEKPEVLSLPPSNSLSVNIIKQMIPNVLKIYLENGQTKSFQYNAETIVKEIFESVIERLQIKTPEHFALVLIGPYPNQNVFLQPEDRITQIVNRKVFSRWECRLELSFSPKNAYELLEKDAVAFEYWYQQTTNSIVKGHLSSEIKYDVIMRLAALQIHAAMAKDDDDWKFSLKDVLKEYGGLDDFLPADVIYNVKKKEIKKTINSQLKSLERIARPGQKLTALQAKLHYLKIASETPAFGGKTFTVTLITQQSESDSSMDNQMDTIDILVSPSHGICTVFNETGNVLQHLVEFSQVSGIVITSHMLNKHHLKLFVKDKKALSLIMSPQDADDMSFLITGYHKIISADSNPLPLYNLSQNIPRYKAPNDGSSKAPPYTGKHDVVPSAWSYVDEVVSTMWLGSDSGAQERIDDPRSITQSIDFSIDPPKYGSSKICDRSSVVMHQQRAAVDSFIRELSIRNKNKKIATKGSEITSPPRNEEREKKKVSQVGQFDTISFGMDKELEEDEEDEDGVGTMKREQVDNNGNGMRRHVISCSLSSDEDESDVEMSELAKKVSHSGTLSKYLKTNGNRNRLQDLEFADGNYSGIRNSKDRIMNNKAGKNKQMNNAESTDGEEGYELKRHVINDSDASSPTESLDARTWSNPWGTFSDGDSTDQDSSRLNPDSESLSSFNDETGSSKEIHAKSDRPNLSYQNSFAKYLVQKEPKETNKDTAMNELLSPDGNGPASSIRRPLSSGSDEVFFGGRHDSPGSGNPSTVADLQTCYEDVYDSEGRPMSVNLEDLNIYIPGPPKIATEELNESDIRIPSPPEEFADNTDGSRRAARIDDEDLTESTEDSSRSSSPDEPVEFMQPNSGPTRIIATRDSDPRTATNSVNCTDEPSVELSDSDIEKPADSSSSDGSVEFLNKEIPIEKLNIKEVSIRTGDANKSERNDGLLDTNNKLQTESVKLSLDLPTKQLSPFREQRVVSPLFFSVSDLHENDKKGDFHHKKSSSDIDVNYDHSDPFCQLDSGAHSSATTPNQVKGERLTLPSTPRQLRWNQYQDHVDNQQARYNSLPSSFSFEEFNVFAENCKMAVRKALSLEDQLLELIEDVKKSNRRSFEVEDAERQSYLDVMRTCSRSLVNKTKDIVQLVTNGDLKALGKLIKSSQNEVENVVVAMLSLRESLTLANLTMDMIVEYKEVITSIKKSTAKPITDPDVVTLMEKNDELTFALTLLSFNKAGLCIQGVGRSTTVIGWRANEAAVWIRTSFAALKVHMVDVDLK
eukprot:gene7428-8250_t